MLFSVIYLGQEGCWQVGGPREDCDDLRISYWPRGEAARRCVIMRDVNFNPCVEGGGGHSQIGKLGAERTTKHQASGKTSVQRGWPDPGPRPICWLGAKREDWRNRGIYIIDGFLSTLREHWPRLDNTHEHWTTKFNISAGPSSSNFLYELHYCIALLSMNA